MPEALQTERGNVEALIQRTEKLLPHIAAFSRVHAALGRPIAREIYWRLSDQAEAHQAHDFIIGGNVGWLTNGVPSPEDLLAPDDGRVVVRVDQWLKTWRELRGITPVQVAVLKADREHLDWAIEHFQYLDNEEKLPHCGP